MNSYKTKTTIKYTRIETLRAKYGNTQKQVERECRHIVLAGNYSQEMAELRASWKYANAMNLCELAAKLEIVGSKMNQVHGQLTN
jgi:hypothetical protein